MKNFTFSKRLLHILTLFTVLSFGTAIAQTPGLIYEPAGTAAGRLVLDPDGNGFTSKSTVGFRVNDRSDSEIPYIPLVFLTVEPTSDLGAGPNCAFTDFVDRGDEDPVQSYVDAAGNFLFRMRMGSTAPNAKSYSVLIDTDGLFGGSGPNRDPQYSSVNPGFEVEIVLATKFGVDVYNVNNMDCVPIWSYPGTSNYQKSIAFSTNCGDPDYFYDFFVNFTHLSPIFLGLTPSVNFNASTPLRMAIIDNMAAKKSTLCNASSASDIAGVDDRTIGGGLENIFTPLINNYSPCAPGTICPDRSLCPGINNVSAGAVVSGTSSEANGTVINVFKNGSSIGTTTVTAGVWTLSAISPLLVAGNIITATATAPGEGTSIANCNAQTVAFTCATRTLSTGTSTAINGKKGVSGTNVTTAIGTVITFYKADGLPVTSADAGGSAITNPFTTTAAPQASWLISTGSGNALPDGSYYVTYKAPGECESAPV